MITDQELMDFGNLACQRCEKAANSVAQLLENEMQATELLINVINSMTVSAATLMQTFARKPDDSEPTIQECIVQVLATLAKANGIAEISVEANRNERHLS
jgi:hypothetical protein